MMLRELRGLLQIVFPLSDDEKSIADCCAEDFAGKLSVHTYQHTCCLARFNDPQVRAAIHLVKFHNNPLAAKLLASLLAQWLRALPQQQYVLIPVPLSGTRLRKRGHNQVVTVAEAAVKSLSNVTLERNALQRVRHTQPQTTLDKTWRKRNLQGAFEVKRSKINAIAGKRVILLDDVTTTGATLLEAKKALLLHRPETFIVAALAH